jgi:hypothetical protein
VTQSCLVGSKHLLHLGDRYSEFMSPNSTDKRQGSWMEYKKPEHGLSEDEEKENEEYKEDYPGKEFLKIYSLMK